MGWFSASTTAKVQPATTTAAKRTSHESVNVKIDAGKTTSQTADAAEFETPSRFIGVKSYLHQFYATPSPDSDMGSGWLLLPPNPSPNRFYVWLCRILFLAGFCVLLIGAVLLIFAYAHPKTSLEERLLEIDAQMVRKL